MTFPLLDLSTRRSAVGLFAACMACAGLVSCGDGTPASASRPGLLLITMDTTRADRLGVYGNAAIETPVLDGLAAAGVAIPAVEAVAPTTLPTHASILTGLYPHRHGARSNGSFALEDGPATLAGILREEGYRTAAVVSAFVLDRRFGLDRGFEVYVDGLESGRRVDTGHYLERRGDRTTDLALQRLRDFGDGPFFLWVHYFDPHHDYAPPEPWAGRYRENPYDGEIAFVDAQIGRLLDALREAGREEETLVQVVGDHGEGLMFHGEPTHGLLLYESTIRVPWILRGPGVVAELARRGRASQVDVVPTSLGLLGLEAPEDLDGIDLSREVAGDRTILAESVAPLLDYGWSPLAAAWSGDLKLILGATPRLFDLSDDPGELDDRLSSERPAARRLRAALEEAHGPELAELRRLGTAREVTPDEAERLKALGYLGGGGVPATVDGELFDPERGLEGLLRVTEALSADLSPARAEARLRSLLDEMPDFHPAWRELAAVALRAGDLPRAREALQRALELAPSAIEDRLQLARVEYRLGRTGEAREQLLRLLAQAPEHLEGRYLLAVVLAAEGKLEEAVPHFLSVYRRAPSHEHVLPNLVTCLERTGREERVGEILAEGLQRHPDHEPTRRTLDEWRRGRGGPAVGAQPPPDSP